MEIKPVEATFCVSVPQWKPKGASWIASCLKPIQKYPFSTVSDEALCEVIQKAMTKEGLIW